MEEYIELENSMYP